MKVKIDVRSKLEDRCKSDFTLYTDFDVSQHPQMEIIQLKQSKSFHKFITAGTKAGLINQFDDASVMTLCVSDFSVMMGKPLGSTASDPFLLVTGGSIRSFLALEGVGTMEEEAAPPRP